MLPLQHDASSMGRPVLVDDVTGVVAQFSFQLGEKGIGIAIGGARERREV
jgi:hypothetical protein